MNPSRLHLFLLACCLLSGQAYAQQSSGNPLEAQLEQLRGIVLEQTEQMEHLRGEVRRLLGENEMLQHKLEEAANSRREMYQELDKRLRTLENAPLRPPETPSTPPPPVPDTPLESGGSGENTGVPVPGAKVNPPSTASPPTSSGNGQISPEARQAAYQQAFNALQAGRLNQAAEGFKQVISQAPQGQYADNAQYWLGETYYAMRDFPAALQAFKAVVENYPDSAKRSHALLKIGYAHYEMNNKVMAREILEQIKTNYPDTATARLAEERLRKMSVEGY